MVCCSSVRFIQQPNDRENIPSCLVCLLDTRTIAPRANAAGAAKGIIQLIDLVRQRRATIPSVALWTVAAGYSEPGEINHGSMRAASENTRRESEGVCILRARSNL